jgi:hypothetical protein
MTIYLVGRPLGGKRCSLLIGSQFFGVVILHFSCPLQY